MKNIGEVDLTITEKNFITTMINVLGDGQHPYCDEKSFDYFTIDYVKKILNSSKLKVTASQRGLEIAEQIKKKL